MPLPVGYRFHPTPEELIHYYLQRKVKGEALPADVVGHVDPFQSEPWNLFDETSNDYFYVFTKMNVKAMQWEAKTVGSGTWVFQNCKEVIDDMGQIIGYDRGFQFLLRGHSESPYHGDWVMHQFSLIADGYGENQEAEVYVVCELRNVGMDSDDDM